MKSDFKVVIIGAGVAGMTCALYLKRANIDCCIIEKETPGGQINLSPKVKNYPGFIEISGKELSNKIFEQIEELNVPYINKNVTKIDYDNNKIYIGEEEISFQYLVLAIGRHPRKLDVEGANRLVGKGVSYCATCDGNFFKGKDVVVIGGGNSALDEALYLSNIVNSVTILNRSNKLRGEAYYIDLINKKDNVTIKYNTVLKELKTTDERLSSVVIDENGEQKELKAEGCFSYIGYDPNTDFIDKIELDKDGYIIVNDKNCTNINNVYAIGDVVRKNAFQLITSMSDGVNAAYDIIDKLK